MKKFLVFLTLSIFLFGCSCFKDPPIQFKMNIVASSVERLVNGTTTYTIAYENGHTDNVYYGVYVKYQKGDTIYFIKKNDFLGWDIVDSDVYYHKYDSINNIVHEKDTQDGSYNKTIIN